MITGPNIKLRLVKQTDLAELYEKWHDAEARGSLYPLALVPEPIFQQEFQKNGFWTDNSKRMLIVDKHEQLLGIIHCAKATNYSDYVELSYFLFETKKRNKGYATEAVNLFVDYLFDTTRINRIQICVPEENIASIRVAKKAGFIHEAITRSAFYLNGEDIDMHIYALLRKEWEITK
jgi:ribosomal-protein-alanine N-acetyltransferase